MLAGWTNQLVALAIHWKCGVRRTTSVIHHVRTRALITSGVGFDYVPAEQREHLIESGVAAQVGVVEVGVAAVAEANISRYQSKTLLVGVTHTVLVRIEERRRVDVGLPLVHGNLAHVSATRIRVADHDRC